MYVLLCLDVLLLVMLDCVKENNDLISRIRLPVKQNCRLSGLTVLESFSREK